jgi:hypothetical protein
MFVDLTMAVGQCKRERKWEGNNISGGKCVYKLLIIMIYQLK